MVLAFWLLQSGSGWRLDLISLFIGLILGAALAIGLYRVLPRLLQLRDQSVSRVRETQTWVRAGVEKRFQVETAAYVQSFHLGNQWAELSQIFVFPLLLAAPDEIEPGQPPDLGARPLARAWPALAGQVAGPPLPAMSVRGLLLNGRRVILAGEAGAGKTTLLAYCAYLCAMAADSGPYTFLLPVMPVFVHLAELDFAAAPPEEDPAGVLARALQLRSGPLTAPGVAALLHQKLAAGQVLLLLDGGDEVPAGRFPLAWLGQLLAQYPALQVVVATGTTGYGPLLALDFTLSGLLPWRAGQAVTLGALWTEALACPRPPQLRHYWHPGRDALTSTAQLWGQLLDTGAVEAADGEAGLADQFPAGLERQGELLAALLRHHLPREDKLPTWFHETTQTLWQALAWQLHEHGWTALSPPQVEALAAEILAPFGPDTRLMGALTRTLRDNPLFVNWADGRVGLRSPVWRDFLAAAHLAQAELHQLAVDHVHDPAWAGVLRFYVGRVGEQGLARWLLEKDRQDPYQNRLFQLASWLPEVADPGAWRRQALIQLGQIIVNGQVPLALRFRAVAALAVSGEPGVLALLRQLMQRTEPELRQAAAIAWSRQDAGVAVPALEKLLADGDVAVRLMAVYALAWLSDPAGEKPLLLTLLGKDAAMSAAVAVGLARNGEEGWQILREAAIDAALPVRRAAIQGLAGLEVYWAVALLEQLALEDDEWAVKSAASVALEAMAARSRPLPWQPRQAGDLPWLVSWAVRQEVVLPAGAEAVPDLLALLTDETEPALAVVAALSLGQVQIPAGVLADVRRALTALVIRGHNTLLRDAAYATLAQLQRAHGHLESG